MIPNIDAMTLSEIVLTNPQTAEVLEKYHLDFCCGGKKTLSESCLAKGLPIETVCDELQSHIKGERITTPADLMTLSELCDHIVKTHHSYVDQSVKSIGHYLDKLVRVHGTRHPELSELQVYFDNLSTDLRLHMKKEEAMLFPYIKNLEQKMASGVAFMPGSFKTVGDPIGVMEFEHDEAGALMEKIRRVTNDYLVPEDGCTTYRLTFMELEAFEHDLHRHVHLENHVLFPKSIALEKQSNQHNHSNN